MEGRLTSTLTDLADEPTLQPDFIRDEDERSKVPYNQFSNEVPIISIAGIDDVEGGGRAEICRKIVDTCEDWGIFQIVDHGVDSEIVSDMARLAREFFALPSEEKLRYDMSGGKKGGFIVSSHLKVMILNKRPPILHYYARGFQICGFHFLKLNIATFGCMKFV